MQTTRIVRVAPSRLRFKLDQVSDLSGPRQGGDWDIARRLPIDDTPKYTAMRQRFVEGRAWEDTDLFKQIYAVRFGRGEVIRGCKTWDELVEQYGTVVDALYEDMRANGFRERIDGALPSLPEIYIGRDGEPIVTNQGNHRVAIAKLLGLPWILARVRMMHADFAGELDLEQVEVRPVLHEGADEIPAMTTPSEKAAYYELALAAAPHGTVVELGTWLGAATVYIAAGVRDAGAVRPMHTFDRFKWQPIHAFKAGGQLTRPMIDQVRVNLGPLASLVEIHKGEITAAEWKGGRISLLIADGPKRKREVARTLQIFGVHLEPGDHMAWQDWAYFPTYDQVVCLHLLEQRGFVSFVRGVFPGTTGIFRVEKKIEAVEVQEGAFAFDSFTPAEIEALWKFWADRLDPRARPRFMCGAVMFLYDRGAVARSMALFREQLQFDRGEIRAKWEYMIEKRDKLAARYPELLRIVHETKKK